MRALISRIFLNFPYEDRASQEKTDKYRNPGEQTEIASKGHKRNAVRRKCSRDRFFAVDQTAPIGAVN
jgi:hypothetical protein